MNCKPKYNNKENLNVEEHINSITNAQTLVARAVDYENKKLVYGEDALSIVTKKLPEFKNLAEQNAVMDTIARLFLNSVDDILVDKKLTDPLAGLNFNLKDLNKNPTIYDDILENIISELSAGIHNIQKNSDENKDLKLNLLQLAKDNLREYFNDNGTLGPAASRLKYYGVDIKVNKNNVSEVTQMIIDNAVEEGQDISVEEVEDSKQDTYGDDYLNTPTRASIRENVRLFIKRRGKVRDDYKYVPGKAIQYEYNILGEVVPINYEKTFGILVHSLLGTSNIEDMMSRLEETVKTFPQIAPLVEILQAERGLPPTILHTVSGDIHIKPISTALYSSFSNANYDLVTLLKTLNGEVTFVNANRTTVNKTIQDNWKAEITNFQRFLKTSPEKVAAQRILDNLLEGKDPTSREKKSLLRGIIDKDRYTYGEIAKLLRLIGLTDITMNDLLYEGETAFRTLKKRFRDSANYSATLANAVRVLANRILKGDNIFINTPTEKAESRYLDLFAEILSKKAVDVNVGAFLSGRGTIVNPFNKPNELIDMYARLQKAGKEKLAGIESGESILGGYTEDPMYSNTLLLSTMLSEEANDAFVVNKFDVKTSAAEVVGKLWDKLSPAEAISTRLMGYFDSKNKGGFVRMFTPTSGDRGSAFTLKVHKVNRQESNPALINPIFDSVGNLSTRPGIHNEVKEWLYNEVSGEIDRIINAKVLTTKYINYNDTDKGNAFEFTLFPELNDIVTLPITQQNKPKILAQLFDSVDESNRSPMAVIFKDVINKDLDYIIKNKALKEEKGIYTPTEISKYNFRRNTSFKFEDIENFIATNFIYTWEQTLFSYGDPAFSKIGENQYLNINKRLSLMETPGTKYAIGEFTGMPETSNVLIIPEYTVKSELSELLQSILNSEENAKAYEHISLADGTSIGSLDRYRRTIIARGYPSEEISANIDKLLKWKPGEPNPDININIPVEKAFYNRLQYKNKLLVPLIFKYAVTYAIPTFYEQLNENGKPKYPTLDKISKRLKKGDIVEIVTAAAVKSGVVNITNIEDLDKGIPTTIYNESVRHPQDGYDSDKTENTFGTQIRKQIEAEFIPNNTLHINGNATKAEVARVAYNSALTYLVSNGGEVAKAEFITENGDINTPSIVRAVIQKEEASSSSNSDYFKQAFDIVNNQLLLPLTFPTVNKSISSTINSTFNKNTVRQTLPGFSAVQISSIGTKNTGSDLNIASDLKFLRLGTLKGVEITNKELLNSYVERIVQGEDVSSEITVLPAEIRISASYFKTKLKTLAAHSVTSEDIKVNLVENKILEKLNREKKITAVNYKNATRIAWNKAKRKTIEDKYAEILSHFTDPNTNEFDLEKVKQAGLDEGVFYRIPTMGKSFMAPFKIKEFFPGSYNNIAQIPAEIVEQASSDFDFDKITLELSDFSYKNKKLHKVHSFKEPIQDIKFKSESQAKAYIYEFHKAVLSSPAYLAEMIKPNNTKTLESLVKIFGDKPTGANFFSLEAQEDARRINASGKIMIERSAVANKIAVLSKIIGLELETPIVVAGKEYTLMDEKVIVPVFKEDGTIGTKATSILSDIVEINNAAVDNNNNPLLGKLNINEFTSNVVLGLIAGGYGVSFAVSLINAPIIKSMAKDFFNYNTSMSELGAMKKVIKNAKNDFGIDKRVKISAVETRANENYDINTAELVRKDNTPQSQVVALKQFIAYNNIFKDLSKVITTLSRDKGAPTTTGQLIGAYKAYAEIKGTYINTKKNTQVKVNEDISVQINDSMVNKDYIQENNSLVPEFTALNLPITSFTEAFEKFLARKGESVNQQTLITAIDVTKLYLEDLDYNNTKLEAVKLKINNYYGTVYTSNIEITQRGQEFKKDTQQNIIDTISDASEKLTRPTEKNYVLIKDGKTEKFNRLTATLFKDEDYSSTNKAPTNAGSTIDGIVRKFLSSTENYVESPALSDEANMQLKNILEDLADKFEVNGEKYISDETLLRVYDIKLKLAGEMDIMTVDSKSNIRIYDLKTMRVTHSSEYSNKFTKLQRENFLTSRYDKHEKQLNGLAALMRNQHNFEVKELYIIPLKLVYNEDGTYISSIKGVTNYTNKFKTVEKTESSTVHLQKMTLDLDSMLADIPDTRNIKLVQDVDVLKKLGIKPDNSMFKVNPIKYNQSYLSAFEKYSIDYPTQTQLRLSPEISPVGVKLALEFRDILGRTLTPLEFTRMFNQYNTYLFHSTKANATKTSTFAEQLENGLAASLTTIGNTKSTAELIRRYRNNLVNKYEENFFISQLKLVPVRDKEFVVMENLTRSSLSADTKKELMASFEELMKTNPALAKSLYNYAMAVYGFSRTKYSFVESIPPIAHYSYSTNDKNNYSIIEYFRNLNYVDDSRDFSPTEFAVKYVLNNFKNLALPSLEELEYSNSNYYTSYDFKGKELKLYSTKTGEELVPLGVPDFVFEYQNGPSYFNASVDSVNYIANSKGREILEINKESEYTLKLKSIQEKLNFVVKKAIPDLGAIKTEAQMIKSLDNIKTYLNKNQNIDGDIISTYLNTILDDVKVRTKRKMRVQGRDFNTVFVEILTRTFTLNPDSVTGIFFTSKSQEELINKIIIC